MAARRDTALPARVLKRGLRVPAGEIDSFPFDYRDIQLTQLMLLPDGPKTYSEFAAELGVTEATLRQRLLNEVRCGWISRQLDGAIRDRLGKVHASVYLAAIRTGDPTRAKYLDTLYGKGPKEGPQQVHLHNHNHIDLSSLSAEELKQFIRDRQRKLRGVLDDDADTEPTTGS